MAIHKKSRCLKAQYDTANAVLGRLSQRQLGILEYLEHVSVVVEHVRDKLPHAAISRNADELPQEQGGRAAMLILVGNDERHLRAVGTGSDADEFAQRDEFLAGPFPDRQRQADMVLEIELGGLP